MASPHRSAPSLISSLTLAGALVAAAGALAAPSPAGAASTGRCQAVSGDMAATLVELYTSEGCSSCPPADRWVSGLDARADVVALGFHVDYWDSLGWRDRFASPANTRRQADSRATSGAGFSYTPQVLVDGRDWRRWPALPSAGTPAPVTVRLGREGDAWDLQVEPRPGAPRRLTAEVAVVDDHLSSRVAAGENQGSTLRHDAVVRQWLPVEAWRTADGAHDARGRFTAPPLEAGATRHWAAVVRDADTGRPVQALALRCPGG